MKSTKLRYLCSKDPNALVEFVNQLRFKIEIKGAPTLGADNKWYLWFILPDGYKTDIPGGEIE